MLGPNLGRDHAADVGEDDGDKDELVEVADDWDEVGDGVDRAGDVDSEADEPPAGATWGAGIGGDAAEAARQADEIRSELAKVGSRLVRAHGRATQPDDSDDRQNEQNGEDTQKKE